MLVANEWKFRCCTCHSKKPKILNVTYMNQEASHGSWSKNCNILKMNVRNSFVNLILISTSFWTLLQFTLLTYLPQVKIEARSSLFRDILYAILFSNFYTTCFSSKVTNSIVGRAYFSKQQFLFGGNQISKP